MKFIICLIMFFVYTVFVVVLNDDEKNPTMKDGIEITTLSRSNNPLGKANLDPTRSFCVTDGVAARLILVTAKWKHRRNKGLDT